LESDQSDPFNPKIKSRPTDRPMTSALFYLRAIELGLSWADLEEMDIGEVWDMLIEKNNDSAEYAYIATNDDIKRLAGLI